MAVLCSCKKGISFAGDERFQLSLNGGEEVLCLAQYNNGWSYCVKQDMELGFVPSAFLEEDESFEPVQSLSESGVRKAFKREREKRIALQGYVRVTCCVKPTNEPSESQSLRQGGALQVTWNGGDWRVDLTNGQVEGPAGRVWAFDNVIHGGLPRFRNEVWSGVKDVVTSFLGGQNGCILAYGRTGSGKTFTMGSAGHKEGVMPRVFAKLLEKNRGDLEMAAVDIYAGQVRNLVGEQSVTMPGMDHRHWRFIPIHDKDSFVDTMKRVLANRETRGTVRNAQSSRSHLIVRLRHSGSVLLDLVDLAGSEEHGVPITRRPGESPELYRQRQQRDSSLSEQEASAINLGLLGLRQVFESLKRGKESMYMYRDTKLTLALRDTLARGCKCRLILNVAFEGDEPRNFTDSLDFGHSAANTSLRRRESEGSS